MKSDNMADIFATSIFVQNDADILFFAWTLRTVKSY